MWLRGYQGKRNLSELGETSSKISEDNPCLVDAYKFLSPSLTMRYSIPSSLSSLGEMDLYTVSISLFGPGIGEKWGLPSSYR